MHDTKQCGLYSLGTGSFGSWSDLSYRNKTVRRVEEGRNQRKEEPEAGVRQDSGLSQGTSWWYVSSKGPAHHWRSICVWINKGRDRWNCWGGRFQLPAQDHFLLVEAVKLWLWPGSLIWRPSAFLDSPLAGVVKWARVRMRGSSQWPPGCW